MYAKLCCACINLLHSHTELANAQGHDEPHYNIPGTTDKAKQDIPVVSNKAYGHTLDKTKVGISMVSNKAYHQIEARNIEEASGDGIVTQGNMAYGQKPQEQNSLSSVHEYDYITNQF